MLVPGLLPLQLLLARDWIQARKRSLQGLGSGEKERAQPRTPIFSSQGRWEISQSCLYNQRQMRVMQRETERCE